MLVTAKTTGTCADLPISAGFSTISGAVGDLSRRDLPVSPGITTRISCVQRCNCPGTYSFLVGKQVLPAGKIENLQGRMVLVGAKTTGYGAAGLISIRFCTISFAAGDLFRWYLPASSGIAHGSFGFVNLSRWVR